MADRADVPALIDHKDLLCSAEAMEALPITVGRLATLVAGGDYEIGDVVEVVSLDQALTATLLRRANSATSGSRTAVSTVRDATVRLGTSALLSMALAASVGGRMNRALPAYGLAEGQLWKQSVAASLTAEVIRTKAAVTVPTEAATAALLHDFGKIVLSTHFGPQVLEMLSRAAAADAVDVVTAEQAVFGVSHADIGGLVAQQWRLPHTIVQGIIHHHATSGDLTPVEAAVSLAHAMVPEVLSVAGAGADSAGVPDAGPAPLVPAAESHACVLAALGLTEPRYAEVLEIARTRYAELAERYEVS